jgi:phosphoribosylformimino-5-aminoimidazole carboxamide ribotide isomerase
MRIIPVLDIKNGIIVRGIGGRREEYRPLVSKLTTSCRPVDVACAFRDQLGLTGMYLADLDAIAGSPPTWKIYEEIQALGCRLWVDAGVRQAADALRLNQHGIRDVVVGLETVAGPGVIKAICHQLDPNEITFSLDLKDGRALRRPESWKTTDAFAIAAEAIVNGVRRLLILDLARVGMGQGTGTEGICQRLAVAYPDVELTAGGGIRDSGELRRLAGCGVTSVLVASALHDGQLRPEHWQSI